LGSRSRKADRDAKANSRKRIKKVTMPIAKEDIKNFLRNEHDYTEEEAEEVYEKERISHPTNVASLKSFQNTWFKGY
jgi:hypothetical protein